MMKYLSKLLLVAGIMFLSCNSSKITSSWISPDAPQGKFKKVLVLGLLREKEQALRKKMEEHIVGDLRNLGYDAICSCEEYSEKAFDSLKEEQALQKLSGSGIEAVLTIVLLDKTKERYYVPGRVNYTPYHIYYREWWGYYSTMYDRIYEQGYYAEDTKYFWESNLYDLTTKGLLYSVQTQSFDPSSAESMSHEYGKLIVNDMVRKGVLSSQNTPASVRPM